MKVWKDKTGKWITPKEFFSRWKSGLEGVTQLQQTKMQLNGSLISLVGILCGIVMCIIGIKTLWWLLIILVGALFNSSMGCLGQWQKYIMLKKYKDLELQAIDCKEVSDDK